MALQMKEEIRAEWVAALTSGEYVQAKKKLRDEDSFCCLGVLCDLFRKKTGKGYWENEGFHVGDKAESYILPRAVMLWAGLKIANPVDEWGMTLSELNDKGASFVSIADRIEGTKDVKHESEGADKVGESAG
jgi:hypothetical protein